MQKSSNPNITLWESLLPLLVLIVLLSLNVLTFGDDALSGSNQFALLFAAAVGVAIGMIRKVSMKNIVDQIEDKLKSVSSAIIILLLVGALVSSWLMAGVIPAMFYYGLKIVHPLFILPISVIVSALVAILTGSSWTTTATIGIAFISMGQAIDIPIGVMAGAVISGAYFGDKLSPLSDTTNLASGLVQVPLYTHIRYLLITTIPSISITLIFFTIYGWVNFNNVAIPITDLLSEVEKTFYITPLLLLVPLTVVVLIVLKLHPFSALFIGILLGVVATLIFQSNLLIQNGMATANSWYELIIQTVTNGISYSTELPLLEELFTSGGMRGMLNTVWLIITAVIFGGVMSGIGALERITAAILSVAKSAFGLVASTVASCLAINITASDQYLSIVVPGKMFQKGYEAKGLAPENLSRTLEDSGTVTSVLIPWNTCGAYQATVLGVGVIEFIPFAIFNYISPIMTLIVAYFKIRIKQK